MPQAQQTLQRALQLSQVQHERPLALECLTHIAVLKAQTGDVAEAAELLAFVLNQSASEYATRMKAHHLLDEVSAGLSAKRLAEAQARGRSTTLETILAAL